jgi:hypothetical protein
MPKQKRDDKPKLRLSDNKGSTGFSDKSTVSVPKEKPAPKPKSRGEAANIARIGAEKFNEVRQMSQNPPAPPRTRGEAATYMKQRNATPAIAPAAAPTYSIMDRAEKGPYPATPDQQPILDRAEKGPYPANPDQGPILDRAEKAKLESLIFPEGVEAAPVAPVPAAPAAPAAAPAMAEEIPVAKPVIDENRLMGLFRKTTGTAFDPKSKMDRARLEELTSFIEQDPERLNKSDTKIALDFYRTL